jgi:hypothetical protein
MYIANPIYDVVFKYLMEDNKVTKQFISVIIGEEVIGFCQQRGKRPLSKNVQRKKKLLQKLPS